MKKLLGLLLLLLMGLPAFADKKTDKETMQWRYEVQDLGTVAKDGKSVIFKIWTYAKKENEAVAQAGKNAVHAVMFKQVGYEPALFGQNQANIETEHPEFFKEFFADGGAYQRYVTFANNGHVSASDMSQVGKEYKIGIKVTVNKADLRKYLEEQGLLQKMNSIF